MSPEGQVWEKRVPAHVTVGELTSKPVFEAIDAIDLRLNRFVAVQQRPDGKAMDKIKPLVIELPDMEWKVGDEKPVLFYLPLPPGQAGQAFPYRTPPEPLMVGNRDATRVACLSFSGGYSMENAFPHLAKLRAWIVENRQTVIGPPRLLLYHFRELRFDFMKSAEWQIPVR